MITLIFCGDLRYCPYISRYIERLDMHAVSYQVLFWNRAGLNLHLPNNYFYYNKPSSEKNDKFKKFVDFIGFRHWLIKHLKKNESDGYIFLSTLTGIMLHLCMDKLIKPYIFDIRDYSYENIKLFCLIEKELINNSFFTAISSKGFKAFLPNYNYIIAHNFNRKEFIGGTSFRKQTEPLKLVWNGTVRFFEFQKHYIDALKNDKRFLLVYHGTGTDIEKYKKYCKENNVNNVVFTGAYENSQKPELLKDAAILNNCYGGSHGDELKHAVSNRFYDGLLYKIPQLVEKNCYKADLIKKWHVGISLESDSHFADNLYDYYQSINSDEFNQCCDNALKEISIEDDKFINKIDDFIKTVI